MISVSTKIAMTRAAGIWLLIIGAAITVYGLFNFGSFMVSWGFGDSPANTNTSSLVFTPAIIPGLLYLFAGWSLMLKHKWWMGFICLVILSAAALWLAIIGVSWYLAGTVLLSSLAGAILLIISRRIFI